MLLIELLLLQLQAAHAMRYLILRHGQTDHNRDGLIQGSSDVSRLTEKGQVQARASGVALASANDRITRTFVSPLTRAKQTHELLLESCELPPPTILADLREIDLHEWEGRAKAELKLEQPDVYAAWQRDPLAMLVGRHRPIVDLWRRASTSVWPAVRLEAITDGATLVVCHGSLGQALLCTALGLDESGWRKFEFPNCGMAEIEWPADARLATQWRWRLPERGCWRTRTSTRALHLAQVSSVTVQGG